jgi:hypothetical protein
MSFDIIAAKMKRTTPGRKKSRARTGHINQTGVGRVEGEDMSGPQSKGRPWSLAKDPGEKPAKKAKVR